MKTPEEIKKGLECCYGDKEKRHCEKCPNGVMVEGYSEIMCTDFDSFGEGALTYIQQFEAREWDLFDLLSSAWFGKRCYFQQDNGTVYSRVSGEYMTLDQAIDEFAGELTNERESDSETYLPKWISVEERLPDDLEEVLILVKETEFYGQYKEFSKSYFCQYIGCVDDGEWFTVWCHGHRYIKDTAKEPYADKFEVTHWMPLPPSPQEVK